MRNQDSAASRMRGAIHAVLQPLRIVGLAGLTVIVLAPATPLLAGGRDSSLAASNASAARLQDQGRIANSNGNLVHDGRVIPADVIRAIEANSSARALGRLASPDPATIAGALNANGTLHFVNSAGMAITPTAVINLGSVRAANAGIGDTGMPSDVIDFNGRKNDAMNHATVDTSGPLLTMVSGTDVYIGEVDGRVFARVDGRALMAGAQERASRPEHRTPDANSSAPNSAPALAAGDLYALAIHRRDHWASGDSHATTAPNAPGSPGVAAGSSGTFSFDVDPHSADFNGDLLIGPFDRDFLISQWGPCGKGACPADLNGDGIVNGIDLGILLGFWGRLPGGGPGPGPGPGPTPTPDAPRPTLAAGSLESLANQRAVIEGIAATEADEDADSRVADRLLLDPLARQALQRLNIDVRDLRPDELVDNTLGREIYNDLGQQMNAGAGEVRVAVNRLRRSSIVIVVQQYARLFLQDPGAMMADAAHEQRVQAMRQAFEAAWAQVRDKSGSPAQRAGALRQVIESSPNHATAREAMDGLRVLLRELYISGLNGYELQRITPRLMAPLTPAGLEAWELEAAAAG